MKPVVLNLGCGEDIQEGTNDYTLYNVDLTEPCNVQADITQLPFKTGSISTIFLFNVIEHIHNVQWLKMEMARVLIPNMGAVQVLTPDYMSPDAYGDPTHVRFFSYHSWFDQYWPGFTCHHCLLKFPKKPEKYNYLPGLPREAHSESKWWDVIMRRLPIPYKNVRKAYAIEYIKMGCGKYEKSNAHRLYN